MDTSITPTPPPVWHDSLSMAQKTHRLTSYDAASLELALCLGLWQASADGAAKSRSPEPRFNVLKFACHPPCAAIQCSSCGPRRSSVS